MFLDGGDINDLGFNDVYVFNMDKVKELLVDVGYLDGFDILMLMFLIFEMWKLLVE